MKKIVSILACYFLLNSILAQSNDKYQKEVLQFEKALSQKLADEEPGTSVVITQGHEIISEKYYGLANIDLGEKLNSEHVLGIASMSKQFTGMAILFLAQDGKLSLDDDITKYFPDLPIADKKISIRQLLSHTSGLPELTQNEAFMQSIDKAHTVGQIIDLAFEGEFRGEPGEKFLYCNTGYTISVALIENLSEMKYAAFLKEKIFIPLKMSNTYACDFEHDANNAVQRYTPDSTGYTKAINMHFSNLIGGGSLISNSQDMAKWGMALISGENLPKNYQLLWNPILLNSGESTEYGLGMGVEKFNGIIFYYHPGMGSGMNSINLIYPDFDLTINVIRNVSSPKFSSKDIALMASEYLLNAN